MEKSEKKVRTSKKNFVIALALLLMTNILMGAILMSLSKATLREQINQRMLDVVNTASFQLDGDDLRDLKAEDKGTEKYDDALKILSAFQQNIELKYIYGIRDDGDGTFSFTIDPDVIDPGEFGSDIESTPALINAANGNADVDTVAHTDRWGRFYSAYSPVFDSNGKVTGIVAVDFDADWYDAKINSHMAVATILTLIALLVGIFVSYMIMTENKRRFRKTMESIEELENETQKLDDMIMQSSIKKLDFMPDSDSGILRTLASGQVGSSEIKHEYGELHMSIEAVYKKLSKYVRYIDSELYTDNISGASNKAAYRKRIKRLGEEIEAGIAGFAIAFYDINEMKKVYTIYGYEVGDRMMYECSRLLMGVFGKVNVYHITGDEFIVIVEGKTESEFEASLEKFEKDLRKYNSEQTNENKITVSKGTVIFDPEKYADYRTAFVEAKMGCDNERNEYYERKSLLRDMHLD